MTVPGVYPPIGDHAIVGDTRAAALITRDGTVDWLCLPRFDSPSIFAALLDAARGGHWTVRPAGSYRASRRYIGETNVLQTTFQTDGGTVQLVDAMTLGLPDDDGARSAPEHELLRVVTGVAGTVELEMEFEPRPDYGRRAAAIRDRGRLGLSLEADGQALTLLSEVPCSTSADGSRAVARFTLRAGERRRMTLASDRVGPAVLPALAEAADERLERTRHWWQEWSAATRYEGPYREAVSRSALALKLLVYSPSGAVIAAPTTSLPEVIGGDRNWDYRYCWLRDAAFTVRALSELGHEQEAASFLAWLLHATRVTLPRLDVLYDVFGSSQQPERELPLEGYRGSRPVRVGNAAAGQVQLDVYGEVVDAALRYTERGGALDRAQRQMLVQLGETVCRTWHLPDHGIWETREQRLHYTQSKMLGFVALERLLELADEGRWSIDRERITTNRDELRTAIERDGFSAERGSYVRAFGDPTLDSAVLSGFLHDYTDWDSARLHGTLDAIAAGLDRGSALLARDENGTGGGAFTAASFWLVECLARGGRQDEARRRFEALVAFANDVGLMAEEVDPATGAALGNFPQALTHIALINAARTLEGAPAQEVQR